MEETSSRKEMTKPGAPAAVLNHPSFLQVAINAILKCLGIENEMQQNPCTDGKVNEAAAACHTESSATKQAADPPTTTDTDPPTDPQADPPSSSTTQDDPPVTVSLAAPRRPGTSRGSGPQINQINSD